MQGIPGTQMTSIFEGQPHKTRPFPIKTRVIWVPGTAIKPCCVFFSQMLLHVNAGQELKTTLSRVPNAQSKGHKDGKISLILVNVYI